MGCTGKIRTEYKPKSVKTCMVKYDKIHLLVVTEDYKSGFRFYSNILPKLFPIIDITVMGVEGYGVVFQNYTEAILTGKYTHGIVIYDSGLDTRSLDSVEGLRENCRLNIEDWANVSWVFNPICFEMVLASFYELEKLLHKNIESKVINILHSYRKDDIDIEDLYEELSSINDEKSLERLFEKEIAKETVRTTYVCNHKSSKLGDCWYNNCCHRDHTCGKNYTGGFDCNGKIATLGRYSSLANLTNLIDLIIDNPTDYDICHIDKEFVAKL